MTAAHHNSSVLTPPTPPTTSDRAAEAQQRCTVATPDEHRVYFPQAETIAPPKFRPLAGPLSPTPNLTLAEAIGRIVAADDRWYALNNGWVA